LGRVVITGAAGFLGSHLSDKFLAEGWSVAGVDNMVGGSMKNVNPNIDFFRLDLTNKKTLEHEAFYNADLVIHSAALAHEGLSVFSPSLIVNNTVMATVNAVTAAIKNGAKRFVFLSSMARYGDHGETIYTEETEPKPQDPYGIAKLMAEDLVRNLCDTHGVEWTIIVPHNIIGSRQKYDDPYRNVASIFANRMLQGKQPIIYGDGQQRRSFTFVDDVVDPLYLATQTPDACCEVINVGPDWESTTVKQLAEKIAAYYDFELDPIYVPDRPQEVKVAVCSADKARKLLNYNAATNLDTGLAELLDWIKKSKAKEFKYHLPLEIINDKTPKTWTDRMM